MKKQKGIFFILALFLGCLLPTVLFSQINEAIEPELKGAEVIDLLDGATLDAWKMPSSRWYLEEGMIIGNTGNEKLDTPEWIYTKQQFSDFEFTCEVKLTGDTSRNTGVYFRVKPFLFKEKKEGKSYEAPSGYEFDVAFHNPGKRNFYGSLGDWYARPKLRVFPDEKIINQVYKKEAWNRLTIRARGNRIEYWLNGHKIIDFMDDDPKASSEGIVGFQIHNGSIMKVAYRNIRIRPLSL
uniref:3-keto-disaccharide hydrolase n=1 Tax=Mariniflexile sp. TaxID=1979402 RepID=UPI00404737EE